MKLDLRDILRTTSFLDKVQDMGTSIVDTDDEVCDISISARGIQLYIGPVDPYKGGSGITILLDHQGNYVDHMLEELDPEPE